MIYAIIDIGSNTIRMAVYKVEFGKLEMLLKKKHLIGLAAYIEGNVMQPAGIDRACEALLEFKSFLGAFQIKNVVAFTTAALRNVDNSKEAVEAIAARTGFDIQVISGDEEAAFDFIGATHAMQIESGILMDIGGASTELVLYEGGQMLHRASLPVGSLLMCAKYIESILPSKAEADSIADEVLRLVAAEENFKGKKRLNICGIGGTFKGAAKLNNEIYRLPRQNNEILTEHLAQIIKRFEYDSNFADNDGLDLLIRLVPDRIKTIVPGMIIADALANYFGARAIVYSDSGVREGYLYDKVVRAQKS